MTTNLKQTLPLRAIFDGCGRPSGRQFLWVILFGMSLGIAGPVLQRATLPPAIRYLIPVVPLFLGAQYVRTLVHDSRRQMDELQLRIYLEAAAVVVCGLVIIMITYPLLQAAHLVGPLSYLVVLVLIVVLGVVGYAGGVRRYR
ncbi:MAG: hypothetical protein ABSH42_05095 [Bryobacteraceae bacterium]|jgi:hypothetical protein